MFRTVGDGRASWESLLPGELLRLPDELARVDALLDDPAFFAPFTPYFHPVLGRPSTPGECCLRLMFLKYRAVWYENGQRQQCESVREDKLVAQPDRVTERLAVGAPDMRRPGADLITHYLDSGRLPAGRRWSRKHADTQRRLCERFAAPVIGAVTCLDIKASHMQAIVNAAPTAGEGDRVAAMISALAAGQKGDQAVWLCTARPRDEHPYLPLSERRLSGSSCRPVTVPPD